MSSLSPSCESATPATTRMSGAAWSCPTLRLGPGKLLFPTWIAIPGDTALPPWLSGMPMGLSLRILRTRTTVLGGYPKNNIHLNNSLAGVDSGQCGFFDDLFYGDDDVCKNMEITVDYGSPWYNMCCDTTLSEEKCGVVPYGAVSSSGVGDGAYGLYYMLKDGQVVAAMLQFMFPGE